MCARESTQRHSSGSRWAPRRVCGERGAGLDGPAGWTSASWAERGVVEVAAGEHAATTPNDATRSALAIRSFANAVASQEVQMPATSPSPTGTGHHPDNLSIGSLS